MKKKNLFQWAIAGVFMVSIAVAACQKEDAIRKGELPTKAPGKTTKSNNNSNARLLKKIMEFMGVRATLIYSSGCYHGHWQQNADGSKFIDVTCNPGCEVCQGRITLGKVGSDDDGNTSVLDYQDPVTDQQWGGLAGRSADGVNLIMGVDKNLVTPKVFNSLFPGDNFTLNHDFVIDQKTAEALGLDIDHMVVPAGVYTLNEDGNIIWWNVRIASMKAPK